MKVVHIITTMKGGAGKAAYRIHIELLKKGLDSCVLCLDGESYDETFKKVFAPSNLRKASLISLLRSKFKWRLKRHLHINLDKNHKLKEKIKDLAPKIVCETFNLPFSDYNIWDDELLKDADIINLHWVANFLDYPTFFKNKSTPIAWTLHDMHPFLGLFHFKADEVRNHNLSAEIDNHVKVIKEKFMKLQNSNIYLIGPSEWILKSALRNKIFMGFNGEKIYYTLNMESFYPKEVSGLREQLNIPNDHTIFLFVAESVNNYRKGFDILVNAFSKINSKKISLLIIGKLTSKIISDKQVIYIGSINDENKMADYYSLADAFIIPSREDNLPNVMLESMACGTPVLSFDVGGMSEIIANGFNGLKAENISEEDMSETIQEFIETKQNFNGEKIREFAFLNFNGNSIAEQYLEVYKKLLLSNG